MAKTLVLYFSAEGHTKKAAEILASQTKGDLFEIRPEIPYTAADLDWHNKQSRSSVEMKDPNNRPAVAGFVDAKEYDRIFLGLPIWWGEAPRVVQTFLEGSRLSGKTITVFATSGGSGLGKTASILQQCCPDAKVVSGERFAPSVSEQEIKAWVQTL